MNEALIADGVVPCFYGVEIVWGDCLELVVDYCSCVGINYYSHCCNGVVYNPT